ncbi:hypothetical protein IWQ57_004974, partial [Coemansia nantahalensis]
LASTTGSFHSAPAVPEEAVSPGVSVEEMSKADFLTSLGTEHQLLVAFYAPDDAQSASVLSELGAFACRAAAHYPNLRLHRVNHKANPYLTARMLLTE